jgi:hypothetical protein
MNGVDDLRAVDPLQVDRGDREVRVSELTLDHDQGDALVGHLDCMGVAQLMRSEPATDSGERCGSSELLASG